MCSPTAQAGARGRCARFPVLDLYPRVTVIIAPFHSQQLKMKNCMVLDLELLPCA